MGSLWCKDCGNEFGVLPFEMGLRFRQRKIWDVCPRCKEKQVGFTELWVGHSLPELDNSDLKLVYALCQRDFMSQIDRLPTPAMLKRQNEKEFQYIRVDK